MQETQNDLPIIYFATAQNFETWMATHAATAPGLWVKYAKKGSGLPSVSYAETVDIALCYGWIDGLAKSCDATYYMQRFTPRRPKSVWSQINVKKVEALTAQGAMKPAGLAVVEAAKKDGRWDAAYASSKDMVTPPDFLAALDANPKAKAFFLTLNKTNAYAFNWRLATAKKPETRQARIQKFIGMLEQGKKLA